MNGTENDVILGHSMFRFLEICTYFKIEMPFTVSAELRVTDVMCRWCVTARMYAHKGACVSTCGANHRADENNTCVECNGECPLKGIYHTLSIQEYRQN